MEHIISTRKIIYIFRKGNILEPSTELKRGVELVDYYLGDFEMLFNDRSLRKRRLHFRSNYNTFEILEGEKQLDWPDSCACMMRPNEKHQLSCELIATESCKHAYLVDLCGYGRWFARGYDDWNSLFGPEIPRRQL